MGRIASDYWARANRTFSRRQALRYGAVGLAGLTGAALIGCGGEDEEPEATATAAETGAATASATGTGTPPAGSVPEGGKFTWSFQAGLTNIDPHIERIHYVLAGYNKLMRNMPDGSLITDLAESVEQPDDLTYTFKLQPAKFHNLEPVNGRQLTAEDVAYSIERITSDNPEFQKKYYFDRVTNIETVDDLTVNIMTETPFAPQLGYAGATHAAIVPKEVDDFRETMIGTGPFMLTDLRPQVSYRLAKNPDYFRSGRPHLDEIELLKVADVATAISRFRSNQLDWVSTSGRDAEQLRGGEYQEQESDSGSSQLRFNVTTAPFDDPRVRQALHLAIDRKQVIDLAVGGAGYIFADLPRYWPAAIKPDELATMPGFRADKEADMAEAKKLLDAAGFSGEFETISYSPVYSDVAQVLNTQWASLGVSIKPIQMEFSEWTTLVLEKKFQAMLTGSSQRDEMDEYYYAVYHPEGARNDTGFADPEITDLCEQQQAATNADERAAIVRDITTKMLDMPVWVPLYTSLAYDFIQPGVGNLERGSITYWSFLLEDTYKEA